MRVFVGGATGYIGAAVARALVQRGHKVLGSARNDAAADKLRQAGVEPVKADLSDAASFGRAAREADAAIQTASTSDAKSPDYEPKAATAILEALAGSGKPFILTSGVWVYGSRPDAVTEDTALNPFMMVGWRPPVEQAVLEADKIRGMVIRPGIVYGNGGGIPAMFVGQAKGSDKRVTIPGDGKNHWTCVHVDDLGELYAIVLESGAKGGIYNGVAGDPITLREIVEAIAKRHGAELGTLPLEEARKVMGPFADALALDQTVQGPKALALGWRPNRANLATDLATGSYG